MAGPRTDLISLAKKIVERQLTISSGGNISTRLSNGRIIITPAKHHKALSNVGPADISVVDISGNLFKGPKPSNELPMHLAIYRANPSATWIVHSHPPLTMAYSSERRLPEESFIETLRLRLTLGGVKEPGSDELAAEVAEKVRNESNCILLEGHGVVIVSNDPNDAFMLLEELESTCKIDLARKILRL